jgi:hypothetical protein
MENKIIEIVISEIKKGNLYCIDEVAIAINYELYKDNNFDKLHNEIRAIKKNFVKSFLHSVSLPKKDDDYYTNQILQFIINIDDFKIKIGKFDSRGAFRFDSKKELLRNFYSPYSGFDTQKELFNAIVHFNNGYEYLKNQKGLKC